MPTPEFVLELRRHIGTAPLWLSGVTAVVLRERRNSSDGGVLEVLLVRRADNGAWTPVTGIIDPGEEPAVAAAREVLEESGVVATATRLASVSVTEEVVYDNGDRSHYLDLTFRFTWVSGDPHPADGENTEARWFAVGNLPPMSERMRERLDSALAERGEATFRV
ncbi:MAG TPA: ADP-ribose pyrophosphatase [Micrococcales bacterium]|uniref:NUDIX domain-containing protein n=1 Tax=Miniimonas arenae TaxID=676201 RepID=A0A5C5B8Q6_9MICO|nr:NUDIX domain-containing protein [Miniimonas arenae]TNU72884.1 NUDIX domain-containing protein [Miniimonas arenae]HCX85933.1 ADP-ribose pyrophosphatase [Micrococcales bacterium]